MSIIVNDPLVIPLILYTRTHTIRTAYNYRKKRNGTERVRHASWFQRGMRKHVHSVLWFVISSISDGNVAPRSSSEPNLWWNNAVKDAIRAKKEAKKNGGGGHKERKKRDASIDKQTGRQRKKQDQTPCYGRT